MALESPLILFQVDCALLVLANLVFLINLYFLVYNCLIKLFLAIFGLELKNIQRYLVI